MVIGMATKKVTVTLDETALEGIRALVAAGTTSSVSGFVQHAVSVALDDVAGWGVLLADALQDTGGELSREDPLLALARWLDQVVEDSPCFGVGRWIGRFRSRDLAEEEK